MLFQREIAHRGGHKISGDTDNGFGKWQFSPGHMLEGQWKGGQPRKGVETSPHTRPTAYTQDGERICSGNKYEGQYTLAKCSHIAHSRSGAGKWTFTCGVSWEGAWLGDHPAGLGTWRFPDGLTVSGTGPTGTELGSAAAPPAWRAAAEAVHPGWKQKAARKAAKRARQKRERAESEVHAVPPAGAAVAGATGATAAALVVGALAHAAVACVAPATASASSRSSSTRTRCDDGDSDNGLGGWDSYRTSKAALNMATRTASLELKRQRTRVSALHPGTVETGKSKSGSGSNTASV
jgi:hypothetical protein